MKLSVALFLITCSVLAAKDCTSGVDLMCGKCMKASGCLLCWGGYPKDKVCIAPQTKVEHCVSYQSDVECSRCEDDYFLENNKCTKTPAPTIKNCVFQFGSLCAGCTGFDLDLNLKSCTENVCELDNCEACGFKLNNAQTCSKCKNSNYYLDSKSHCAAKPVEMINCDINSFGNCISCTRNKYVSSFKNDTDFRCSTSRKLIAFCLSSLTYMLC